MNNLYYRYWFYAISVLIIAGLYFSSTCIAWRRCILFLFVIHTLLAYCTISSYSAFQGCKIVLTLECGPMPNVMAALLNIGSAVCPTPQNWLTPNTGVPCSNAAKTRNPLKLAWVPQITNRSQPLVGRSSPYSGHM